MGNYWFSIKNRRQLAVPNFPDFCSKIFKWISFLKLYFLSIWLIILSILSGSFCLWPPKVVNFAVSQCTWINFNNFFKSLNVAPHFFGNVRQNCDSPARCSTLWDKFAIPFFRNNHFFQQTGEKRGFEPPFHWSLLSFFSVLLEFYFILPFYQIL